MSEILQACPLKKLEAANTKKKANADCFEAIFLVAPLRGVDVLEPGRHGLLELLKQGFRAEGLKVSALSA